MMSTKIKEAYIRDSDGQCRYLPENDAIEQFLSPDGYRITLNVGRYELVIRKDCTVGSDSEYLDEVLGTTTVNAMITCRKE